MPNKDLYQNQPQKPQTRPPSLRGIGLLWPRWFQIRSKLLASRGLQLPLGPHWYSYWKDWHQNSLWNTKASSSAMPQTHSFPLSPAWCQDPCLSLCRSTLNSTASPSKPHPTINQLSYILTFLTEGSCYSLRMKYDFPINVSFCFISSKAGNWSWRMLSVFCLLYKMASLSPLFFTFMKRFCLSEDSAFWNEVHCPSLAPWFTFLLANSSY